MIAKKITLYTSVLFIFLACFLSMPTVNAQGHGNNHDGHNHGTHDGHNHGSHGKATNNHAKAGGGHGADHSDSHGEGEFNVTEMILHHIADANEFHVLGDFSIPLPCILYNRDKGGVDMFLSSKFEHGHKTHNGYKLDHGRVASVNGHSFIDFSITKNVFTMLLASLLLCLIFFSLAGAYKRRKGQAPKGLQALLEPLIVFVEDDIAKANIGPKYKKFTPYLLTVFFFILICNLFGLIPFFPGSANVTGNIAVTLVLSVITFILTNVNGTKDYWGHIFWMPGVPTILKPVMAILEFIGIFTKPFALMIRLFANISGGHIIILSLVSLIFIFGKMGQSVGGAAGGAALAVPLVLFMNVIELFVAFLQAYIFTMLSALFIGLAVEEHDHEHAH